MASSQQSGDQCHGKKDEKDNEKDLGDSRSRRGNARKAKNRCDNRDNEKYSRPVQHGSVLCESRNANLGVPATSYIKKCANFG